MDAFADGIAEQMSSLRRYARALLRSDPDADDLVQESVLRALSKRHLWQEDSNLRAWLFAMLHNQFVNRVRRSARQGRSVDVSDLDEETHQVPRQDKRLELRDLDRALVLLPEEHRIVVLLIGLEGMDYATVAKVVGVPVGTIRSRLSRGREGLRRLMGMKPDSDAEAKMAPSGLSLNGTRIRVRAEEKFCAGLRGCGNSSVPTTTAVLDKELGRGRYPN